MKKVKEKATENKDVLIDDTTEVKLDELKVEEPNGHKPEEALMVVQAKPASTEVIQYEVNEGSKEIPGSGFFFNVQDKFLPESSRLTERQIQCFAVGDVQQQVLNTNRKKTVYEIFRDQYLRYEISANGEGRAEFSTLVQLKQDEANRRKGDLFDKM